jgi:prophage regulatory protein
MSDMSNPPIAAPSGRLLRMKDVVAETSLSQATINRLHRTGQFPPKVQISANCVGWWESHIEAWKAERRMHAANHT